MKRENSGFNKDDLRLTHQRQVILDEFRDRGVHLTADEVYNRVRMKAPKVSLGTIYRNLEILSDNGLLHKTEMSGHQMIFDGNMEKHHHFKCIECGEIYDISSASVKIEFDGIERQNQFKISDFSLELSGVCASCNPNSQDKA